MLHLLKYYYEMVVFLYKKKSFIIFKLSDAINVLIDEYIFI